MDFNGRVHLLENKLLNLHYYENPLLYPHKLIILLLAGAAISEVVMMVTLNLLRPAEKIIYLVTLLLLVLLLGYVFSGSVAKI